jgi:protein-S-isoprenylcysteine O-methyltransferase Ste14
LYQDLQKDNTMDENIIFRIIVIAIILVCLSISIYFRRKAQSESQDEIDHRQEGSATMVGLRIGGLLVWFTVFAYIFYPPAISWASVSLPSWIRWLGVAGSIAAALLLGWMFASLGMNITDSVTTRHDHKLVTGGPYRWIRHPLYTFGALLFLSISLIMGSWLIPLLGIPTYAILIHRTGIEEKKLEDRFGEQYQLYTERTGRFFPRLS